jgi:hypothetical protein
MRFALVLFTLFWTPLAYGQEPVPVEPVVPEVVTIKLPETLTVKAGRIVRIDADTTGKKVRWLAIQLATDATKDQPNILPEDVDLYPVDESAHSVFFCCPTSGTMTLFAWTAGGDYPTPPAICRLVIEQKGPRPPPGPNPPGPDPTPKPNPASFRVLFVYESAANHTREQLNIINSTAIAAYLNEKCVKDSAGRAEWRRFDPDVTLSSKESETIKKLWEATKPALGKLPQVVIVVDGKGEVFDLPETEAETLALLKKYAEGK